MSPPSCHSSSIPQGAQGCGQDWPSAVLGQWRVSAREEGSLHTPCAHRVGACVWPCVLPRFPTAGTCSAVTPWKICKLKKLSLSGLRFQSSAKKAGKMIAFANTSTNKQIGKADFFLYLFIFFPFSFLFMLFSNHGAATILVLAFLILLEEI